MIVLRSRLFAAALICSLFSAPADAARIVTLAPHLAELVCAAGGCDQIVAVSAYSDFPSQLRRLPQIGDGFSFNLEAILALRPDHVLAWDGGTPASTVQRLRALGVAVTEIRVDRLDNVAPALQTIGTLLHTEPQAAAAAQAYRTRLAQLRARWRASTPIRVVYQIGVGPAYTVGGGSPISDVLALCGGVNVFSDLKPLAAPIGAEAMLAAQPQAVLFGGEDNLQQMRAYWSRLPGTQVIQRGTLYPINADWLARAAPRMLDGVEQVCQTLDDARRRWSAPPAAAPDHGAEAAPK